ncbi:MAG: TonB-dependent receptor [Spirochaetales bacterium]|nr:TonB-dependent receptor [Spirochaetales bacterium]
MKFFTTFSKTQSMCVLILCISTMWTVSPAWSQEQGQTQTEPDIEVVVTADRVETETTKIPAHVTVITAEELKAKGNDTVVDALEVLSGVSFRSTNGNAARAEISMRGFGENSHGRVLVLLDGRRLNQPDMAGINWLQVPIENIERIEIVHGGNSVLYGDHAVGGVVNIITKKGSEQVKLDAFASAGSFFDNQERLGVTGNIGPFDLVINAEHTGTLGYREHSALESIGAGLELGLDMGSTLYSTLTLSYEWLSSELPGSLTQAEMEDDPTQSLPIYSNDKTENHTLNSMLSVQALLGEWGQLQTDVFYNLKIMQDDMPSYFPPTFTDKILHALGAAPRLNTDFLVAGCSNSLTAGADLSWDIFDFNRYDDVDRDTKNLAVLIIKSSYSGYLNNKLSLSETLHLNAGIRYEFTQIAADASLGTDLDDEKVHHAFVWDAGVVWEFLPQSKLYSRFERVYRYPFIDEQVSYYGFGSDQVYDDIEAEYGYNIETGSELKLFDDMLTMYINLFYLEMENEIAFNNMTMRNENMDRTRRIGGEAGVSIEIENFLIISGNYTYTYATFIAGDNEGKFIPLVPENDIYTEITFTLPLGFSLGSSLHYRGICFQGGDFSNTSDVIEDYFLLNGFVKYTVDFMPGKLQIMCNFKNILDNSYATLVSWGGYYPEPGFNWKISVSYGLEL